MSRRLKLLPVLEGHQRDASDPRAHAALSASAGTGKTQVLIARVLRLLIGGVPPSAILCLTFTKSGAAEMANRLGDRLASWVRLPEKVLEKELFALGEPNDKAALQRARRLFARVIEAPGGLRIQTIHAFAQTLLASFPAEAGVTPGFQPIEGRAEAELARRTLAALLSAAEADSNEALIGDVSDLSRRLGEQGAEKYLMDCARAHAAIAQLGEPAAYEASLLNLMKLGDGTETADELLAHWLADDQLDVALFHRLIDANRAWGSGKIATSIVANLTAFLAAPTAARGAMLDSVGKCLVKADGDACKASAGQTKAAGDYDNLVADFAEWLRTMRAIPIGFALAKLQSAGLRAGAAFAAAYVEAKRAAGVADFDDLIRWTRELFREPGMGDWIRFKLDQRIDHVLVDEAQDTNSDQWAIVDALIGEYFSGSAESEDRWRTLFMVGDFKQAIYSFQGSDPQEFDDYRQSITERAAALAAAADAAAVESGAEITPREFRDLSISASFRSSPAVLDVVDGVIGELGHEAMGLPSAPERHSAARPDRPGSVELWPPFIDEPDADAGDDGEEGWIEAPVRRYADRVARQVRDWIAEAPTLATTGRPLTAGDVLILVRSRTELAALIVARLFEHGVAVAGIDRLHLAKPLAVKDLLAAIRFAVQPEDDLNLASLLVSPLLGWDQQQLFDLAYDRGNGMTLWRRLQRDPDSTTMATLRSMLSMADNVTPARFLGELLSGPLQGRRKLISRLGEAARDPIEELVSIAFDFERQETASLDRFLAWFASGEVEVKRDPAAPSNAVRVMTVHGAKGLEAPVVLLADATHDPAKVGQARSTIAAKLGGVVVPLIRPRANERVWPFADMLELQKIHDLQEHWRLLYVGLTRAAERLVVAGVQPKHSLSDNSWHSATRRALEALGAAPHEEEGGLRWELAGSAGKRRAQKRALATAPLPEWATALAPEEERPPRPLSPSSLGEDREAQPPPSPAQRDAARHGTLIHSLFERLPAVSPPDRTAVALRWLERQGVADPAERTAIICAALRVIDDPDYAELFGPTALAEAPIAATLPDGRVIAGTVDRLCIGETVVRVVDFKTGRFVPASLAEVPSAHRAQMAAYAEALAVIFPSKRVEAALLYTHAPKWIALGG